MIGFAESARPKFLSEVYGQGEVVADLKALLSRKRFQHVLFSGPSGSGKTTLSLNWAKALLCSESSVRKDACGKCQSCIDFESRTGALHFRQLKGGELDAATFSTLLEEQLRYRPMNAPFNVAFIDEAQALKPSTHSLMLVELERRHPPTLFILSLIDDVALPYASRQRFTRFRLLAPDYMAKVSYVLRVAQTQGMDLQQGAIDLLARAAADFRGLARLLERVELAAAKSEADVRQLVAGDVQMALHWLENALRSSESTGESGGQRSNVTLLSGVREVVSYVIETMGQRTLDVEASPMALTAELDRQRVTQALTALQERLGFSQGAFTSRLLSLVGDPAAHPTELAARLRLQELRAFLGSPSHSPPLSADENPPRWSRTPRRVAAPSGSRAVAKVTSAYMSADQARRIVNAGSALMQRGFSPFNLRFSAPSEVGVGLLCTRLAEYVHRRWPEAQRVEFVWLRERRASGEITTALLSMPPIAHAAGRAWLASHTGLESDTIEPADSRSSRRAVAWHWRNVRSLLVGLDPGLQTSAGLALHTALGLKTEDLCVGGRVQGRRFGASGGLALVSSQSERQLRLPLLSAFDDAAWEHLYSGWELKEAVDRKQHVRDRSAEIENLRVKITAWRDVERITYEARLSNLADSWPQRPPLRTTSWRGWW